MERPRMSDITPVRRHSRLWLYAPFVLLALLAAGWSAIWGFARSKVDQELDAGIAREARAGRNWTCRERNVGGYPFRIEVRCASLALTSSRWGDEVKVDAGPAVAVAQVWTPGHIILQMTGPMLANLPQGRKAALDWKELGASLHLSGLAFERFSLVLGEPVLTVTEPGEAAAETWRASAAEAHLRPNPQRFASEGTVDLAVNAKGGVLPALLTASCTFSKARTSIWRTRSRLMSNSLGKLLQRHRLFGQAACLEDAPLAIVEHASARVQHAAAVARSSCSISRRFSWLSLVVDQPVLPFADSPSSRGSAR
jgi:hypothetical protein